MERRESDSNLSPKALSTLATVAEFGDYSRQCGQGFNLQSITYRSFAIPRRAFTAVITSPRGPHVYLAVTYFQFHGTAFHLVLVLFVSQLPKYGVIPPHILQSQTRR